MHAYCNMCMAWHSGIHGTTEKLTGQSGLMDGSHIEAVNVL